MIGIDRYSIRHTPITGGQKAQAAEDKAGAATQAPPVLLAGGSETGQSSKSKLSAAFWSIQSSGKGGEDGTDTPEAEFTKLSKMTLAERIRAQILEKHKLSESDFKSLGDSDRQAIEEEIRKAILQAYGAEGGKSTEGPAPEPAAPAETSASTPAKNQEG